MSPRPPAIVLSGGAKAAQGTLTPLMKVRFFPRQYLGVAQLVARVIWDHKTASSSLATQAGQSTRIASCRTKSAYAGVSPAVNMRVINSGDYEHFVAVAE